MLLRAHHGNLNMRAAILQRRRRLPCRRFSVIAGGVLIAATGIARIDPILSLIVATIIVVRYRRRRPRGDRRAARERAGTRGDPRRAHAIVPRRRVVDVTTSTSGRSARHPRALRPRRP